MTPIDTTLAWLAAHPVLSTLIVVPLVTYLGNLLIAWLSGPRWLTLLIADIHVALPNLEAAIDERIRQLTPSGAIVVIDKVRDLLPLVGPILSMLGLGQHADHDRRDRLQQRRHRHCERRHGRRLQLPRRERARRSHADSQDRRRHAGAHAAGDGHGSKQDHHQRDGRGYVGLRDQDWSLTCRNT